MNANPTPGVGKTAFDRLPKPVATPEETHNLEGNRSVGAQSERGKLAEPQTMPEENWQSDIRLRFLVDAQSKEVTVLILDRASKRVLRTIPPEELTQLSAGDLVELFA